MILHHSPQPAQPSTAPSGAPDVVILGAGPAGMAAAIHLARGGLDVTCLDPEPFPRARVGESLDWSTPGLLEELGVAWRGLLKDGAAVVKRGVRLEVLGEEASEAYPPAWVARPPLRFGLETLHADRAEMDLRLWRSACQAGVRFDWQKAREVEVRGDRVVALTTAAGQRLEAPWFIDASGRACRLLARRFGIASEPQGPAKVSLWAYFETDEPGHLGTTFHIENQEARYLSWIWEIPIRPREVSVGCVVDAATVRDERRAGAEPRDLLARRVAPFPRLARLAQQQPEWRVHSTGYVPCASRRACGENWLLAGEAAAVPDPLTANGVTAALRHGRAAAHLVLAAHRRGRNRLGPLQRSAYNMAVRSLAAAYNRAIEGLVYSEPVRCGLGPRATLRAYTFFGYTANALASRFRPRRWLGVAAFALALRAVGLWVGAWRLLGRVGRWRSHRSPRTEAGRT